ncbi:MAG: FAD-dependent oxidoreductase [Pseudomonadota bacterium]
MSAGFEAAVVGGGLLGSAVGYGLARAGLRTVILDEGDAAFRAARGNFGLVWVQGKGVGSPAYAGWTARSAALWPEFAAELEERTGTALQLSQKGGIDLCLDEAEFEARGRRMEALATQPDSSFRYEMLGRNALARHLRGLGPEVVGGSYSEQDGHVDPLRLLGALQRAFVALGGTLMPGARVSRIVPRAGGVALQTAEGRLEAERLVLAAGLGNRALAPQIGLEQPVHPEKGQVLVSERAERVLDLPTTTIRQSGDGTILLGDSKEDAGFDIASTPHVMRTIADRARRSFPALARLRVLRSWAALRVMTPDGLPVYDRSETVPGAFAISCHSGVTLAAAHALAMAPAMAEGALDPALGPLGAGRFDVQAA